MWKDKQSVEEEGRYQNDVKHNAENKEQRERRTVCKNHQQPKLNGDDGKRLKSRIEQNKLVE